MKRSLLLVAAALCPMVPTASATAQDTEVTFLFGLSSATHGGSGANGWDLTRRNGFMAGGGLSTAIAPNVRIGLQAIYTTKGSVDEDDVVLQADYLDVPLLVSAAIPIDGLTGFTPVLMGGPVLGLKTRVRWVSDGVSFPESEAFRMNGTDLGFALGAGIEIPAGGGRVAVTTRYVAGLQDIWSEGNASVGEWKNRSLQLLAGYSTRVGWFGR